METKGQIRSRYKQIRVMQSKKTVIEQSRAIAEKILGWEVFKQAEQVLLYYPLGNEADLREITEFCWNNGKHTGFPIIVGKDMKFCEIYSFDELKEGYFHVMEPVSSAYCDWKHALVFTPGVVFDRNGGRFGYGKGFYDQFFQLYPDVIKAGIALQCQIADDELPVEKCDMSLDYLITPEMILNCQEENHGIN